MEEKEKRRQQEIKEWEDNCNELLDKTGVSVNELQEDSALRHIYVAALVMRQDLKKEFGDLRKQGNFKDSLVDSLKVLHFKLDRKIYDDFFGSGEVPPEGPVEVEPRHVVDDENLACLLEGYNQDNFSERSENYRSCWDNFRKALSKRFALMKMENKWRVAQGHFPSIECRLARPNCEYLNKYNLAFFIRPKDEPQDYLAELISELNNLKSKQTIPIVITTDDDDGKFIESTTNTRVITCKRSDFLLVFQNEHPRRKFKQLIFRSSINSLGELNPFNGYGCASNEKSIFYGRDEQLDQLANNPASLICGGRRIGKTTILRELEERLKKENYIVVNYPVGASVVAESHSLDRDSRVAQKIINRLKNRLPEDIDPEKLPDETDPVSKLDEWIFTLGERGLKIGILLDEFDVYLGYATEREVKNSRLLRTFRERGPSGDGSLTTLVVAGFTHLYYQINPKAHKGPHPPLGNLGQKVSLGAWSYHEASDFIKYAFRDHLGIEISEDAIREVIKYGSTTPAYLQQFCRLLLFNHLDRKALGSGNAKITGEIIKDTFNDRNIDGGESFMRSVDDTQKNNLSGLGRLILLTIIELLGDSLRHEEKITTNTDDRKLERFYSEKDIRDAVEGWIDAELENSDESKLAREGLQEPMSLKLEDEEFELTIDMLGMTGEIRESPKNAKHFGISTPSFVRILMNLQEVGREHIEKAIWDFARQKNKHKRAHVYIRG
tara:strand:- start:186 stop:2354 length:2169 start_codon:yes stop_codon:yes gene_type:complete